MHWLKYILFNTTQVKFRHSNTYIGFSGVATIMVDVEAAQYPVSSLRPIQRGCYCLARKARIILLVDLRDFFFRFIVGGRTKKKKKFFNVSRTNSLTIKVNQQSVLNL